MSITAALPSAPLPRLRRSPNAPAFRLTERDLAVLTAVAEARVLTTSQVHRLLFPQDHTRRQAQLRLQLLYHHGFLHRSALPILAGDGSVPFIYQLDQQGALLLEHPFDKNALRLTPQSIAHLVATSEVYLSLRLAAQRTGLEFSWQDELGLRRAHMLDIVTIRNDQGQEYRTAVVPDGHFTLTAGGRAPYCFFLELDRGTVTAQASSFAAKDWQRKIAAYRVYINDGFYERRYGTADLRILTVVTTGDRRLTHLKQVTEGVGGKSRFWFATMGRLTADSVLAEPIWDVATRPERQSLL